METKMCFFQFEIIINVLVSSLQFIWIPMLRVYGHYRYFIFFSAWIVFIRQNLTSTDGRFWRIKTIPALKGSMCSFNHMCTPSLNEIIFVYIMVKVAIGVATYFISVPNYNLLVYFWPHYFFSYARRRCLIRSGCGSKLRGTEFDSWPD